MADAHTGISCAQLQACDLPITLPSGCWFSSQTFTLDDGAELTCGSQATTTVRQNKENQTDSWREHARFQALSAVLLRVEVLGDASCVFVRILLNVSGIEMKALRSEPVWPATQLNSPENSNFQHVFIYLLFIYLFVYVVTLSLTTNDPIKGK
jgi:hypothetical protein